MAPASAPSDRRSSYLAGRRRCVRTGWVQTSTMLGPSLLRRPYKEDSRSLYSWGPQTSVGCRHTRLRQLEPKATDLNLTAGYRSNRYEYEKSIIRTEKTVKFIRIYHEAATSTNIRDNSTNTSSSDKRRVLKGTWVGKNMRLRKISNAIRRYAMIVQK